MDTEQKRREKYKGYNKIFQRNAFILIDKMVKMASLTQEDTSELVDEILHSIFFLGEMNDPKISPREIFVRDDDMFDRLKKVYPEPFRLYSSTLPRRSPFSCVLDMVVHLKGQENEKAIINTLRKLVKELMKDSSKNVLFSTTICISAGSSEDSVRHYGVSMSTKVHPLRKILIAASCLNFWEEHVADAVMSYYPVKKRIIKKEDFSVHIKLPAGVRCDALKLTSVKEINPCRFCKEMFSLVSETQVSETQVSGTQVSETQVSGTQVSETQVSETQVSGTQVSGTQVSETQVSETWLPGNCAEAESLSNLLREKEVRERVQIIGNWTEVNKKKLRCEVRYQLTTELREFKFAWDNEFYVAQKAKKTSAILLLKLLRLLQQLLQDEEAI